MYLSPVNEANTAVFKQQNIARMRISVEESIVQKLVAEDIEKDAN